MADAEDLTTLRLRIEGHVQAVGFRYYATLEARKLGLSGWIRNLSDGAVEALASGSTKAIEAFVAACMRGRPARWSKTSTCTMPNHRQKAASTSCRRFSKVRS